jgi:type IV pilus assembly protein PilC
MPRFAYDALDSQGKEVKGEVEALTIEEAQTKIRQMDYFPTSVKERAAKKAPAVGTGTGAKKKAFAMGRVSSKSLTVFTRQLSTLIDAGLPVVRSLRVLEDQLKKGTMLKNNLIDIIDDVESGTTLSEAMAKHPKTFDRLYVSMIRAGEAAGALHTILDRLAIFMEKSQKLKKRVISAMIYPVVVISVVVIILTGIMIFVIPRFTAMFSEMDVDMPTITIVLITVSKTLARFWFLLPGVPFGFWLLFRLIVMTEAGRYGVDKIKLMLPVFGSIVTKSTISRFARTLGTLLQSGVPILQALTIVREAAGNAVVANAISKVHDSIREGDDIAGPLAQSKICDNMVVNMVAVGEETGELAEMLLKVADTYDEDVDALVGGMMSLIEPMLVVVLGSVVAFIVMALFMPLIKLMTSIGKTKGGGI